VVEQGCDFPHIDKKGHVLTSQTRPTKGYLTCYQGDLRAGTDVNSAQRPAHFCDGGTEGMHLLSCANLIKEIILSVVYVLPSACKRLFRGGRPEQVLELLTSKATIADRYNCIIG